MAVQMLMWYTSHSTSSRGEHRAASIEHRAASSEGRAANGGAYLHAESQGDPTDGDGLHLNIDLKGVTKRVQVLRDLAHRGGGLHGDGLR